MIENLGDILTESYGGFVKSVFHYLPNFFTSLLILLVGLFLGYALRALLYKFLKFTRLDRLSDRTGLAEVLQKGGVREPFSLLIARAAGWIVIIVFIAFSMHALRISSVARMLERFLLYLPNIFAACLILLFGYVLSNFFGRAALIAAVNAGSKVSGLLGKFVKYTVFLLTATMALEQLKIGSTAVLIAFAIIFGGVVFALAVAFGLGGKDVAKDYLEKKIKGSDREDIERHL